MTSTIKMSLALAAVLVIAGPGWSQEANGGLEEQAQSTLESARERADAVVEAVDANTPAQEVSAGILKPIYRLAEAFSFSAFHWLAFSVMVAGVVSSSCNSPSVSWWSSPSEASVRPRFSPMGLGWW